jgi:hypothetical protein
VAGALRGFVHLLKLERWLPRFGSTKSAAELSADARRSSDDLASNSISSATRGWHRRDQLLEPADRGRMPGIVFPCDKTTAGPGARRGSRQEPQGTRRQGNPHHGCGEWLHHGGEVRDAQVPLSRRDGWCLALRSAHRIQRLESDPRAFPNPKERWGPKNRRELSPRAPALQQDRLFGNLWAATREGSRENKKCARGGRRELTHRGQSERSAAPSEKAAGSPATVRHNGEVWVRAWVEVLPPVQRDPRAHPAYLRLGFRSPPAGLQYFTATTRLQPSAASVGDARSWTSPRNYVMPPRVSTQLLHDVRRH